MLKSHVAINLPCASPCVRKGSNTRKNLAFQQLHGSTTTRAAMGDFIHCVVFLASCCSVTTTNDGDGTLFGCSNDGVHEGFRAGLELAHLKDTHRAIPNNGFRCVNCSLVQLNGFRSAI